MALGQDKNSVDRLKSMFHHVTNGHAMPADTSLYAEDFLTVFNRDVL